MLETINKSQDKQLDTIGKALGQNVISPALRVGVIVPTTHNVINPFGSKTITLANPDTVQNVQNAITRVFSEWFGGASKQALVGTWLSGDAAIEENTTEIYAYAPIPEVAKHAKDLYTIGQFVRDTFNQDCVLISVTFAGIVAFI